MTETPNPDDDYTLFVRVASDEPWPAESMNHLAEVIGEATPDYIDTVVTDGKVQYMDRDEVESMVADLVEALDD